MASDASVDNLAKEFKDLPPLDKYPNCFPDINPVDIYRSHISSLLAKVTGVDSKIIYPVLQWTSTLDKGDIVLPIPALRVKGKPADLGAEWLAKWPGSPLVETPVPNGAFLSFFFKPGPLTHTLIPLALKHRKDFGNNKAFGLKDQSDPSQGRKRIIVEFSSPNIAKPFHAGHLRSTIIGGFLANLYEAAGWDVVRINYLGDWGKQYGLLALGFEKYGNEEDLTKDPINHLFQVYVKINVDIKAEQDEAEKLESEGKPEEAQKIRDEGLDEQARRYFKLMTESDEKALAMWKRFRDLSITRYKQTYARLNIHFDDYSGESQVAESDMEEAANKMKEMGLTEEDKGAQLIDFSKHVPGKQGKSLGKVILRKKDGTALYLTRDISELLNREKKYKFDQMIYVIASQQDLHCQQFFKVVELMGHKDIAAKVQHINFGMVLGMSTRKGTVKFLDDILRDVGEFMHDVMRKNEDKYKQVENPDAVADTLGISSVMVQDMTGKRSRGADLTLLTEKHAINLVRVLAQWPDVVANTLKTLEPTTILTYLFKMTHALSSSYDVLRVVGSEHEVMRARMALYDSARVVLNNGMRLLGLSPVER
ncbi:arginyl-tRNA synthetase [Apiospora aurea]|uniref:arginine--tRNA ligase n=1 Tax=Apiospora aurea TaxID=335848 RepID=A0ABR1QFT6_9PEZI